MITSLVARIPTATIAESQTARDNLATLTSDYLVDAGGWGRAVEHYRNDHAGDPVIPLTDDALAALIDNIDATLIARGYPVCPCCSSPYGHRLGCTTPAA